MGDSHDWNRIVDQIQLLDQKLCSELVLSIGGSTLTIGGGNDHYVATLLLPNGKHYQLINHEGNDQPVQLIVGSVETDIESRYVVDKSTILQCAKYVLENASIDPTLPWEQL